jgi:hypothetical protein
MNKSGAGVLPEIQAPNGNIVIQQKVECGAGVTVDRLTDRD